MDERSTEATLPTPNRSRSSVTRRATRRGARVRPGPFSSATMPAACSFLRVRDRFDSLRLTIIANSRTEPGRRVPIRWRSVRLSEDNSFTMASGEVLVLSAFSPVATESNHRFGIFLATWGSAMTRLVHRRKSPTDPVLYVIGNFLFSHHAFHLPPEVIKQLW